MARVTGPLAAFDRPLLTPMGHHFTALPNQSLVAPVSQPLVTLTNMPLAALVGQALVAPPSLPRLNG